MGRLDGADRPAIVSWKRGWYAGVVIEEYDSLGTPAYTFKTEDRPTTAGENRSVQLCIGLVNGQEVRHFNYTVYYSPESLFDDARVAEVLAMAIENKKQRGRWADTGMQRDYLSFVQLHEIEKALNDGKELEAEGGGLDVSGLIGRSVDAFYSIYQKTEVGGKKVTKEVPLDQLKEWSAGKMEWEKGWFGGIKYLAPIGSNADKKPEDKPATTTEKVLTAVGKK
jgi:hypothetical protein